MNASKKLDELPTEVLLEIFNYVPNRWNLTLVCWDFYEIVCEVERERFSMNLTDVSFTIIIENTILS